MHTQSELDTSAALRQQHLSGVVTSVSPPKCSPACTTYNLCECVYIFFFTARWSPEGENKGCPDGIAGQVANVAFWNIIINVVLGFCGGGE